MKQVMSDRLWKNPWIVREEADSCKMTDHELPARTQLASFLVVHLVIEI